MGKPRTGSIQQRGRHSWRIRYLSNDNIRQAETILGTREDAQRELAIRLGEIAKGLPVSSRPNTVLFEELAADVLTDYKVNGFSSYADQETRYRLHILPVFGKRKASQITTAQLKHYILMRQSEVQTRTSADPAELRTRSIGMDRQDMSARAKPVAPGTICRELELIRHTFRLAMQGRKLVVMPHVPMLREDNVRSGFFTREEVERLTRFLAKPLSHMVWFGFLTGWRLEECRQLCWRNVDFERGEIRIDVGGDKNRAGRVFPMTSEIRVILRDLDSRNKANASQADGTVSLAVTRRGQVMGPEHMPALTPYVFSLPRTVRRNGKRVQLLLPIGEFRKQWKTACFRAGLQCAVEPIKIRGHLQLNADGTPRVKVIRALRSFHDLRRSAAREMSHLGIPQPVIMQLMGHQTASMFTRYRIVSEEDLAVAREKMDGHRQTSIKERS